MVVYFIPATRVDIAAEKMVTDDNETDQNYSPSTSGEETGTKILSMQCPFLAGEHFLTSAIVESHRFVFKYYPSFKHCTQYVFIY